MKLVASMMVAEGEQERYLRPCLDSLETFCDEIRVVLDAPCDSPTMRAFSHPVTAMCNPKVSFYEHEGRARQRLLEWTLEANPTHILAIDADEFISDGALLRETVSVGGDVWTLEMTEIWSANENQLNVRVDRKWGPQSVPILYRVPENAQNLTFLDRALACGREPVQIRRSRKPQRLDIQVLHFGWANPAERDQRYQRYVQHDGGNFHANTHLLSILDGKEQLRPQPWPSGLAEFKDRILERCL